MIGGHAEGLRLIAHHEAGHAVAAQALSGLPAAVRIWLEPAANGGAVFRGSTDWSGKPAHGMPLFALAGAVAQAWASGHAYATGPAALRAIFACLSSADHALIGNRQFTVQETESAVQFVGQHWPAIEARAADETARFHRLHSAQARPGVTWPRPVVRLNQPLPKARQFTQQAPWRLMTRKKGGCYGR